MAKNIDLLGLKFGKLTAVRLTNKRRGRLYIWECQCECLKLILRTSSSLMRSRKDGSLASCGCYHAQRTHGKWGTTEHDTWESIKSRTTSKADSRYHDYGGRGITICERWRYSFENFIADMGGKPSPNHSIDRINVNGNYEPSNCRWATSKQQCVNKRTPKTNTSGVKGICYKTDRNKHWIAQIGVFGKTKWLGAYHTKQEAIKARKEAEDKYFPLYEK